MPDSSPSRRRDDIQGLRAIAVLSVVAYHADLPIPGGFVGVDVFFVISGFVITSMLQREWERTGTLRLGTFYLRRFKRLTPALAVVVVVSVVGASLLLSPFDRQSIAADTGVGAMLLVANAVIASVSGEYFAAPAEGNPLLHTWSLSVEEQFYILFPALLLLACQVGHRVSRQRAFALALVVLMGLASLTMIRGASLGVPADSWLLGFYSPLNRAWEFAAGAALALAAAWLPWLKNRSVGTALGLAGALLVLGSFWTIDGSTPFPGKATIWPVAGTTFLIAAGFSRNLVTRALSLRPAARIGDLSYSLYLWHWPFIVFGLTLWPLEQHVAVLSAGVSVLAAVASFYWVEQPIRSMRTRRAGRTAGLVAAFVLVPMAVSVATAMIATRVWVPALQDGRLAVAYPMNDAARDRAALPAAPGSACSAPDIDTVVAGNGLCRQLHSDEPIEVVLLGDSHAEHLFSGFEAEFPDVNVGLYSVRGPYLMGTPEGLTTTLDGLEAMPELRTVVISRFWSSDTTDLMETSLQVAVERLTASGIAVLVADDIPSYPFDEFSCAYRRAPVWSGQLCSQPRSRFASVYEGYAPMLASTIAENSGAQLLATAAYFCDEAECSMAQDDRVLYGDRDHLNADGARWLVGELVDQDEMFTALVTGVD